MFTCLLITYTHDSIYRIIKGICIVKKGGFWYNDRIENAENRVFADEDGRKKRMKMNIMIVTNSRYIKPAYVMLYSLFVNHPSEEMDVYLPYEDLTVEELDALTDFVGSFSGKVLHPLYVGSAFKERVVSRNGINVETYYRILGIDLLPEELDRILYLDVDMVICGSLGGLYETDLTGCPFAVAEDIFGIINGFHDGNRRRLGIPLSYSYFNAGVMLYNLQYLKETNEAERMLENIYQNYERYEYNDQDVMNELYYDRLRYVGWDQYNCPPAWYYIDKQAMAEGRLVFAGYNTLRQLGQTPQTLVERYQNVTKEICQNAKIIHYLADTKPWSTTRGAAAVYEIFDPVYMQYENEMKQYRNKIGQEQ